VTRRWTRLRSRSARDDGRLGCGCPQGRVQTEHTGQKESERQTVRIVWPHHPLYTVSVPLVEFWRDKSERGVVVELPDGSHTRLPTSWIDDGDEPLAATAATAETALSLASVRELIALITQLRDRCMR